MRKTNATKKQKGFTLLELLIYMAILSIVMVFITQAFLNLNRGQGQGESQSDVNANIALATQKIEADIRAASAISTPALAGSSSPTLSMTVSGTTVQYCVVSGQLYREPSAGACSASSVLITAPSVQVAAPTFTRTENTNVALGRTAIGIQFTLSMSNKSDNPDAQFSETKQLTAELR